jgi:pyruvate dehydrogenase E2 component (dihydrolipoamide acetyltransferase)
MAVSVVMPALEMAQETGKLIAWRKREGDRVAKGEPLLEIETDKAVVEIEAPGDGVLAGINARDGAVVPVGQTIAWLVQPGEAVPADAAPNETGRTHGSALSPDVEAARAHPERSSADMTQDERRRVGPEAIRISPKARRLARERGIDLATIRGSGPSGEILADDIESAIVNQSTIGNQSAIPNQSAIRNPQSAISSSFRLMAERTTASWTTVPHFFLTRDVDARALVAAQASSPDLTHTDRLIALVAQALRKHPRMNGGGADVNVAIAIAISDAVVTGVVRAADTLSLAAISARRRELTERARGGRLQPADIAGATFTISNLGMYHVDAFTAIIVPPQAGILAVGTIADRVVAVDGTPVVRPMMTLTLSCDHRAVDGVRGAAFLNDLAEAIAR